MDAETRGGTVTINGIAVEFDRSGDGPPLLFLHPHIGLANARPFLAALARRFTVYAPSHPGFGRSDRPKYLTTVDDLAYFYLDLIQQLGLTRIMLVGASFGGWLAVEIATKSSERIARLTLIDALGVKLGDRESRDIADFFATKQTELDRLAYVDPAYARVDHAALSEDEATILFRNRESAALFGWSPYMHNPKLKTRLHRIGVPTLMLWGGQDGIASPSYGERYARLIPGARFARIEHAGHFPHIEQPAETAERIIAFAAANEEG